MHTLAQLKSGQLAGISRLALSENLTTFPTEIFSLADTLEILDLSHNQLSALPNELKQLKKLKIIFASNNHFEILPESLGQCESLEMVGFKSNKIRHVPAESLPAKLRWLILTDNQLTILPDSLGERPRLQKLALAGNQLTQLPANLSELTNLELVPERPSSTDTHVSWVTQSMELEARTCKMSSGKRGCFCWRLVVVSVGARGWLCKWPAVVAVAGCAHGWRWLAVRLVCGWRCWSCCGIDSALDPGGAPHQQ